MGCNASKNEVTDTQQVKGIVNRRKKKSISPEERDDGIEGNQRQVAKKVRSSPPRSHHPLRRPHSAEEGKEDKEDEDDLDPIVAEEALSSSENGDSGMYIQVDGALHRHIIPPRRGSTTSGGYHHHQAASSIPSSASSSTIGSKSRSACSGGGGGGYSSRADGSRSGGSGHPHHYPSSSHHLSTTSSNSSGGGGLKVPAGGGGFFCPPTSKHTMSQGKSNAEPLAGHSLGSPNHLDTLSCGGCSSDGTTSLSLSGAPVLSNGSGGSQSHPTAQVAGGGTTSPNPPNWVSRESPLTNWFTMGEESGSSGAVLGERASSMMNISCSSVMDVSQSHVSESDDTRSQTDYFMADLHGSLSVHSEKRKDILRCLSSRGLGSSPGAAAGGNGAYLSGSTVASFDVDDDISTCVGDDDMDEQERLLMEE